MTIIKLQFSRTGDGIYLEKPAGSCTRKVIEFDPDVACRSCGEVVLSLSMGGPDICPWCDGSINRPKLLKYQEESIEREFFEKHARD